MASRCLDVVKEWITLQGKLERERERERSGRVPGKKDAILGRGDLLEKIFLRLSLRLLPRETLQPQKHACYAPRENELAIYGNRMEINNLED